ncbi:CHASE domain-containing protein (plasmid) [Yersinia ruckeri]|uniref:CHASE domain-containing protein n=1 Tax=Yersinia ruckeri TaxID=29486 RepID=UPI002238CAF5|nr:CHASE domain-containing protein [Yersinia ruckeri]MCW6564302.1 CHASE domain-containing protein [Yersinia ruckeri]MCW6572752.1 CHASE domain-containing protein [Yersinia ruckeri]MCW6576348.1 CHASE domain-containing protein [Yersinia ruckeri]UZX67001.1 CHASE domain-containing protein [Yersinia ruckeri]UZX70249.1 CHASE domain-containing protein [Yersinia ruckeri]
MNPSPFNAHTQQSSSSWLSFKLQQNVLLPLVIFIVGLAISGAGAWWLYNEIEANAKVDFQRNVDRVSGEVERRFNLPIYGLNGAKGTYAASSDLTREQFHAYVASRNLPVEFPGVRGFGFIQRVQRNQLNSFMADTRADSAPNFTLRQLQDKQHDDLYIIKYIEPSEGNQGAEGLDVGSEPVRRAAVLSAINSGKPTLSGSIHLVQANVNTPGVLLFVPVYIYGSNPTTPAERQASLVGILYSPIAIAELLSDIPEFMSGRVDVELFDSINDLSDKNLVFNANGSKSANFVPTEEHSDKVISVRIFHSTNLLRLPGRDMTLRISSTPTFEAQIERYVPWLLFAFGLLLSSALALLIRQQASGRDRAERLARNMTADLERLALVAKNTSNAVVITDVNRKIVWVNEGFERITGYSLAEAFGKSPGKLLQCSNTDQGVAREMRIALDAGESFKGEIVNRTKSGREYWIELEIQPRYNDKNELIGFMAIESDISERKATYQRLEAALRENNALLSTLNLHGIISTADRDGIITDVNDAFCTISGYSREELIGQTYRLVDSHTHSTDFWQSMWHNIANGISWRGEICNKAKDGSLYWVDTTIAPFNNSTGQIERYISIQVDITANKNQQTNLTIARNQLVRAADVAELGIWTWNIPEGTLSFDDRMNDIYGVPEELHNADIPLAYWYSFLHPEDILDVKRAIKAALENESVYRQVFRIVVRNQIHFIQSTGTVERDESGKALLMMGINRDITQQREAENILKTAREAAEEANKAKSAFLANMSHELRTPMNAILGMLTLLRRTGLDRKQADYAVKSEAATRTLLRLLNDILDFSKIESGKMALECIPFDIHVMLRDLAVILSSNLKVKKVEVLFDIDPSLPQFVEGDSMRLQQILTNLGGNALKFTELGEVVLFIKVITQDSHYVTLHFGVRDTGIGIATENQESIFSGFTQAEASTTRRFGGTGLGLVISQRFVALMGGTLALESQPGQGSLFHFTLTLSLPSDTNLVINNETPDTLVSRAQALNSLRVLVVDDNPTACDLIKRMGESLKWTVDVATSGNDALQLMRQQRDKGITYGALFIDWQMPGLDGWQTSKCVRELMPVDNGPMIVMITAHDREMLLQRSEEDQTLLDGYLVKPITASMLLDSVIDALNERKHPDVVKPAIVKSSHRLSRIRLLIVEDNLNNQQIARELLEDEGAEVRIANHGKEAIEILAHNASSFDLVLMDLQMPVMDGFNATQYIRESLGLKDLPIIAMTANAMVSDRDACLAAGMNDHIGKPFDLNNLIHVIRKYSGQADVAATVSHKTPSSLSIELNNVAAAAGIDVDAALNRLGGDIKLYQKMLSLLSTDLSNFPAQLNTLMDKGDNVSASRLLHTIKGLAAQLGATELSLIAGQGEALLNNSVIPTPDTLNRLLNEIRHKVSATESGIIAIISILSVDAPNDLPAIPPSKQPIRPELDSLMLLLQNSDMAALEVMNKLMVTFSQQLSGQLLPLSEAVNQLDFVKAISLCQILMDNIFTQQDEGI